MRLTRRQKLAGIFKIAALFEAQTAGAEPTADFLQGRVAEKMVSMERALRPAKETAKEPAETLAPTRVPTV